MIMTDLLIVGFGPAGMMAAIYGKRANREVRIIEKSSPGGRVRSTFQVENYLGFGRVNAEELVNNMVTHLETLQIQDDFGVCEEIKLLDQGFLVRTERENYQAKAVIVASGTKPKPIGCINELKFLSKGVSYCAVCDGIFYEHQDVVVVGGGDSALEESIYLANICKSVTILHDLETLTASQGVIEKVKKSPNIKILHGYKVLGFYGEKHLEQVQVEHYLTKEVMNISAMGAFIYVGNQPETAFLQELGVLDESGYVLVNTEMQTPMKGLFAAGDVTKKDYRLIATAISDGAIAALSAVKYLDHQR